VKLLLPVHLSFLQFVFIFAILDLRPVLSCFPLFPIFPPPGCIGTVENLNCADITCATIPTCSSSATNGSEEWRPVTKFTDTSEYLPLVGSADPITPAGNPGEVERIVGGQEATPNSYPWAVVLKIDFTYLCGGSIISASWVLTAAHCVDERLFFQIQAGGHNRNEAEPNKIEIFSNVAIVHENYDGDTLANDVALIKLPTPLTFNAFIQPICLSYFTASSGYLATAMGWGVIADGGGTSDVLRFVNRLEIITNGECPYSIVNDGTLCVKTTGGRGICSGDSGGALALQDKNDMWLQVGVSSFVATVGCEAGIPAGFARVETFLDWIIANTAC